MCIELFLYFLLFVHFRYDTRKLIIAFKVWNLDKHVLSSPLPTVDMSSKIGAASSGVKIGPASAVKKIQFEDYGFSDEKHSEIVTKCPVCFIKFDRATFLLYHMKHNHKKNPVRFVSQMMDKYNELYNCGRCMKKCSSPIGKNLYRPL